MIPKSGQLRRDTLYSRLVSFDPDRCEAPVVGQVIETVGSEDVPMHRHMRGQLLTSLRGTVTAETAEGLWPIPPDTALWIPGGQFHRSIVSSNGTVGIVYMRSAPSGLPAAACFLALTPLVREMVLHLARLDCGDASQSRHARIADVLVAELGEVVVDRLYISMPTDPRLRRIATCLLETPGDKRTLSGWAEAVAMSERSLRRQIERETGVTFGRWRQQFHLAMALRDLKGGVPIKVISESLGYESVSAFSTMFKKSMGRPPGKYIAAT